MDVTVGDRPSTTRLSRSVALVEAMDAAISAVGTRDTRGFLEHCGYGTPVNRYMSNAVRAFTRALDEQAKLSVATALANRLFPPQSVPTGLQAASQAGSLRSRAAGRRCRSSRTSEGDRRRRCLGERPGLLWSWRARG